jgi:hypothetical protein
VRILRQPRSRPSTVASKRCDIITVQALVIRLIIFCRLRRENDTKKCIQRNVILTADNVCKLTYDKSSINFKLNELNYLLAHIATFENQLSRYSVAQNDVILYVTNALDSDVYVEPRLYASTYVLYDVLYDELEAII